MKWLKYYLNKAQQNGLFQLLEVKYAIITFVAGIILILIVPLNYNFDEFNHYARVQSISYGNLVSEIKHIAQDDGISRTDAFDDVNRLDEMVAEKFIEICPQSQVGWCKMHFSDFVAVSQLESDEVRTDFRNNPQSVYSLVSYLPHIIGFKFVSLFGKHPFNYMLVRLFGLLAGIGAMFYCLRRTPFGKFFFFIFGLTPMIVQSFASITADTCTYIAIFLFLTQFLRFAVLESTELDRLDYALLMGTTIGLGLIKISYAPIALLILLLPLLRDKFKVHSTNKRSLAILSALTFLLSATLGLLWYLQVHSVWVNYRNPSININYILQHPLGYLKKLIYFWFGANYNGDADNFLPQGLINVAVVFPWLTTICIATVVLSIFVKLNGEKKLIKLFYNLNYKVVRCAMIGITAMVGLLILTALFICWIDNSSSTVSVLGFQGRYFLVLVPLVVLPLIPQTKLAKRLNIAFIRTIPKLQVFMLGVLITTIVLTLYVR